MSFRLRLLLLLLALTSTACASGGPPPAEPELALEIPPAWTAGGPAESAGEAPAASGSPDRWWTSFGDPRLDAVVDEGLEHFTLRRKPKTAIDE